MIQVVSVFKHYGNHPALQDVSFVAREHEVLGLLGENGAGKTTLMNVMSGYQEPDAGTISIEGFDLFDRTYEAKRSLGYLPEIPPLYPEMTVQEYLAFCIELKEVIKGDREKHLVDILQLTGLKDAAKRKIANLSHGYKQRAGLAQALCGSPKALLLDEPTNGLDPSQVKEFRELIARLKTKHIIILSSHVLSLIQSTCDRAIILHQGRLVADRTIKATSGVMFSVTLGASPKEAMAGLRALPSVQRVTQHDLQGSRVTQAAVETNAPERFPLELNTFASGKQIPILSLTREEVTLEDIYLNAIRQAGGTSL